jgi:hypothetical protein
MPPAGNPAVSNLNGVDAMFRVKPKAKTPTFVKRAP